MKYTKTETFIQLLILIECALTCIAFIAALMVIATFFHILFR